MLGKFILEQRKKHNLTQEFLASQIGVSRPTYVQIEQSGRDLTISEAKKLADVFEIPFENFLQGEEEAKTIIKMGKKIKQIQKKEKEIRISIPQEKADKFRQIFLYILKKVGGKPNVGMTVLYKLLYFMDFDYYEKYEEQLMGLTYIKNHHGPTPKEFIKVIEEMKRKKEIEEVKSQYFTFEQRKYLPHISADLSQLNGREVEMIDAVLARLSDKSASELSDYSHSDVPWMTHEEGEEISYESVFYRNDPYSVRKYDDEL